MAHVTLHFSFGLAVATLVMLRRIHACRREGRPLASVLGHWLVLSYAVGTYACIPSLLRQAGLPDAFCDGWWMNAFLFYAAIKRVFTVGGMPLGGLALGLCFAAQYGIILAAILRATRMPSGHALKLTTRG